MPTTQDVDRGGKQMTQIKSADIFRQFSSGTQQVRQALDDTRSDMRATGADPALCDTSQIILGEVLNNVVEHAYSFEEGHPIELSIWLTKDGLRCEVVDRGVPMPNGVPPAGTLPEFDGSLREALPEGGFGWAMVRKLTDNLQYFRTDGINKLQFLISCPAP